MDINDDEHLFRENSTIDMFTLKERTSERKKKS